MNGRSNYSLAAWHAPWRKVNARVPRRVLPEFNLFAVLLSEQPLTLAK
jgi:hypothetical protein